jgi:acyl-CoA reductase-like NAD-dependent aldehyde dehydrogenase
MTPNGANERDASFTVPLLIDGKEVVSSTTFSVVSPSDSETLWQCSSASVEDATAAVEAASAAFSAWSKTKPSFRRSIFLKAADLLDKREGECHGYLMRETGSMESFAKFNTSITTEMLRDVSGRIEQALHGEIPVCAHENTEALLVKEPFGVVLGIAPWYVMNRVVLFE